MPRKIVLAAASTRSRLLRAAAPAPGSLDENKFRDAKWAAAAKKADEEAKKRKRTKRIRAPMPGVKSGPKGGKKSGTKNGKKRGPKSGNKLESQNGNTTSVTKEKKDILNKAKGGRVVKTKDNKKGLVPEREQISRRRTRSDNLSSPELIELPVITKRRNPRQKVPSPEPSEDEDEIKIDEDEVEIKGKAKGGVEIKVKAKGGVDVNEDDDDDNVDIDIEEDEDEDESEDEEADWT